MHFKTCIRMHKEMQYNIILLSLPSPKALIIFH